jgi:hypothetical protein
MEFRGAEAQEAAAAAALWTPWQLCDQRLHLTGTGLVMPGLEIPGPDPVSVRTTGASIRQA